MTGRRRGPPGTAGLVEACWLVGLAAVPVLVNPYSRQSFGPDKTTLFAILVVAMLGAGCLARRHGPPMPHTGSWRAALGASGLVAVSAVASAALSIDPYRSWAGSYLRRGGAMTELLGVLFFLLVARHLRTVVQTRRCVAVLVAAGVPVSIYALFQRLGFDPVPWNDSLRVGSTTGNPVFLGAFLALLPPLTLALLVSELPRREWTGGAALRVGLLTYALALQTAGLLVTESRGPLLALAGGLLLTGLAATRLFGSATRRSDRRLRRARALLAVTAILGIAGLFALARTSVDERSLPFVGRLATALDPEAKTNAVRLAIWDGAADRVRDPLGPWRSARPWVGHGQDTFGLAFAGVAAVDWARPGDVNRLPDRAHNEIWELLVSRGILGLAAWLIFHATVVGIGLRRLGLLDDSRARNRLLLCLGLGAAAAAGLALASARTGLLGPALGLGLAAGLTAFAGWGPALGTGASRPAETLAVLGLLTVCSIHWIEIQVGFAVLTTRVVYFVAAGALVGLGRREPAPSGAPSRQTDARLESLVLGLAAACSLLCLGFALASSPTGRRSPAALLLGELASESPAPAITPFLTAVLATLLVCLALLPPAPPRRRLQGPATLTAAALVPSVVALAVIHGALPSDADGAMARAAVGITAYRLLLAALLALLVAPAAVLTVGNAPRRRWGTLAAVGLIVGLAAVATDPVALDRVEADTFAKHGLARLRLGDAEDGRRLLDRASELAPREPFYWQERGRLELSRAAVAGPDRATAALERAVELAPLDPDTWANLGFHDWLAAIREPSSERRAERLAGAARAYDTALSLRPAWPEVLEQRATVAALAGDAGLAADLRRRAEELLATSPLLRPSDAATARGLPGGSHGPALD